MNSETETGKPRTQGPQGKPLKPKPAADSWVTVVMRPTKRLRHFEFSAFFSAKSPLSE
jgi:hypothetical protein